MDNAVRIRKYPRRKNISWLAAQAGKRDFATNRRLPFFDGSPDKQGFYDLNSAPGKQVRNYLADTSDLFSPAQKIILTAMNPISGQSFQAQTSLKRPFPVCIAACIGLIVLGTSPILLGCSPAPTFLFFNDYPGWQTLNHFFLAVVIGVAVFVTGRLDPERGAAKYFRCGGFVLVAALLTDVHFFTVDVFHMDWQMDQYSGILIHHYPAPDQYRFLPQGTLWWMILCTGDFVFSYLAYRFFFTFLVCESIYLFARLYLAPRDAVIVVLFYAAFYPLSTRFYYGNLLDPMSHAVMLAALTGCQRQRYWQVFWLFVLGMFIKETMLLIIPCYYLLNSETLRLRDPRVLARLALLAVAGVVVFLACRIPFRFHFDLRTLNRTNDLMVYSNLGLAGAWIRSNVPIFQTYLHPILFIFMWLPLIVWWRKWLPRSLFWTALYLAVSFYLTNLCFSWNHESRNFVPVLIFLLVCAMIIVNRLIKVRPSGTGVAES